MIGKEMEEACREMDIGRRKETGVPGSEDGQGERNGRNVLVLREERQLEGLGPEAMEKAEHLIVTQSVFENHLLYQRRAGMSIRLKHVTTMKLLAEKEKVSLFFLPVLAETLPGLKLMCVEGKAPCTLSVDRDDRIGGYSFMVFSRNVHRVTRFYTDAPEGVSPLLCLPDIDPNCVCRTYRVHLMIPYGSHPEWYGLEDRIRYNRWLRRCGRMFFLQAMEEKHGELLEEILLGEKPRLRLTSGTCRFLAEHARGLGQEELAFRLEKKAEKTFC
ncbi:MAG: hypothetical protein K6A68_01580 [Clostridiales bacterium]|nr:hypothetical protein [Clostridiales bacterium]